MLSKEITAFALEGRKNKDPSFLSNDYLPEIPEHKKTDQLKSNIGWRGVIFGAWGQKV